MFVEPFFKFKWASKIYNIVLNFTSPLIPSQKWCDQLNEYNYGNDRLYKHSQGMTPLYQHRHIDDKK